MQQFVHEFTHQAPLAAVVAMLRDPGYRERVCARQAVLRSQVSIDADGAGSRVRVEQVQPTTDLPSFVRNVIGEELTIVRQETWQDDTSGEMTLSIPGGPGEIAGTIRLAETAGATTQRVDLTIKVSVPLMGAKLESVVADMLTQAFNAEQAVAQEYLAQ